MSWSEIKHAINSTLGTKDFGSLDKIVENGLYENFYDFFSVLSDVGDFGEALLVVPKTETIVADKYSENSCVRAIIPSGVKVLEDRAFRACTLLKSIKIPEGVTSIGNNAFWGCTSLESVDIPNSVTTVLNYVFRGCTSLSRVKIGNGLSSIPQEMFYHCTSLRNISIPEGVTSIDQKAFYECFTLTSIVLPSTLRNVADYAFDDSVISNVYFRGTEEQWGEIYFGSGNDVFSSATIHYDYVEG